MSSISQGSMTSSRYNMGQDNYSSNFPSLTLPSFPNSGIASDSRSIKSGDSQAYSSPAEQFSTYPLHNWSFRQQNPVMPSPTAFPPLSYFYRPHRLEDIAPRDTIMLIIALFFDFVYPLTPCVHKPSYMADLHARREERDPLFFALVMSTVASTLVQLPRSYLPMERHAVRKLAQMCHEASRHISVASYDPPASIHVVIRYLCVSFLLNLLLAHLYWFIF